MTPALYYRAKAVFLEVCELPEPERAARVEERCGGEPELRSAVDELLRADLESSGLEAVREHFTGTFAPSEEPFPRVSGYRILEKLGEGGMGAVYRAEQVEPVRRQVALKIMRSTLQGVSARARFQAERQALARLAHPNIAAMYEAGATDEGFPYFVMELVEGERLTEHSDRRRLTPKERLALFIPVCRGVEHAHRKGIVHRDLTPSNVLVTEVEGRALPKIIDFGIARVLEDPAGGETAPLTVAGFVGTPGYMSPEALATSSDLDTRADVYSLGILLHELLAGVRPHRSGGISLSELIVEVTQTDPQPLAVRFRTLPPGEAREIARMRGREPAALARELAGDLTWIVRKATARARDERYGSASELADELARTLEDLPVRAAPPSIYDRARKLARRHRAAVVAGALAVVAVAGGIVGITTGFLRAREERRHAQEVSRFLTQLIDSASPWQRSQEASKEQLLVEAAREVPVRLREQPRVQAELLQTIGQALLHGYARSYAEPVLRQALALNRELYGPDSVEAAGTMRTLGVLLGDRADDGEGQEVLAEAEAILRRCVLIRERHGRDPSGCRLDLGTVLALAGKTSEAETVFRTSLEVRQRLLAEHSPGVDDGSVVISAMGYGGLMTALGCFDDAERPLIDAVERALRAEGRGYLYAKALRALGELRLAQRRFEEAEQLGRAALGVLEPLLASSDMRKSYTLNFTGAALRETGNPAEATAFLQASIALIEAWGGRDHVLTARPLTELGLVRLQQGHLDEARALIEKAKGLRDGHGSFDRLGAARTLAALAAVRRGEHRLAEALSPCRDALALLEGALRPGAVETEEMRRTCLELSASGPR